ncbi:MAG: tetratricopeptide repeat protein [Terriglobia bacterium]
MKSRTTAFFVLVILIAAVSGPRLAQAQSGDENLQYGLRALQQHNFAAAEQAFSKLVRRDPSARNYNYLALAEAANGKLDQATVDFQKSIDLGANSSSVYYNLGLAYLQRGEPESAIQEFRHAISLNPEYLPGRYAMGMTLLRLGRARQAVDAFNEARKQAPRDPRLWAALVEAEFDAGYSQQAVESAREASEALPNNPRLAVTLASACLHHRQIQTARNLLEDANELMPQNSEVRILLAKVSLRAGEPVEALAVLRGMPSSGKKDPEEMNLMGEARALTGNLGAAQEDIASALKDDPNNARYLTTYAWIEQLQGRQHAALATLLKAQALDPKTPAIPYKMAVSYYFLGQYQQAEAECTAAIRLKQQDAPAYVLRGMIQLRQKHLRGAVDSLQKAVRLNPGAALFHRELGKALFESGQPITAGKEFDRTLALDPKDAEAYFWRAKSLAREGSEQQAIASLNTAVELKPNYADAYAELAELYAKAGQLQQAAQATAQQKRAQASSETSSGGLLRSLPDEPQ